MTVHTQDALFPSLVSDAIGDEILGSIRRLKLSELSETSVIKALGGRSRVLPEGKPTPCAAMTYLAYISAGGESPEEVVPVAAAMEMLMAAYDVIDDIQDDEEPLPADRHAFGRLFRGCVNFTLGSPLPDRQINGIRRSPYQGPNVPQIVR
jgi:hypothetical protein